MSKEKFRYYMNMKKVVHRRAESLFNKNAKLEKVYSESYIRVSGMDDLSLYVSPKPKSKNGKKKTVKTKKK